MDGGEPKVAGKNEAESGKDFVIAGTGPGGYGEIQRNWKWHSGGLTTSSGKKTQANWYSPDDYLTLLSKTNAAATTADKLNLFSSAAKGGQKSSADAGQRELENFVGDGSNDNAASSILMAAQIRANNANTYVSGRADLSSVNVEDFIGFGLLLKQLVKQGTKIGVGEAAKGVTYTKSSLQLGQQMHKAYKAGLHNPAQQMFKEFVLPSGRRIDFLDASKGIIYELKPFNPRAMKAGQNQLNMYIKELQSMPEFKGINWKTVLDTY